MNPIPNFDYQLRIAAEVGDINPLYTVIQNDPTILERIDIIPFVETPLHIAASMGHLPFAIEVMNLKPSFSLKLNPQGFSPIHVAIQVLQDPKRMVLHFVDMNKDLVRVKGREGMTPLHLVCEIGEVEILAEFLTACPDSIEDVTVRGETALHIAVKNHRYNLLELLVCFLMKNTKKGARKFENKILNRKDVDGNTILHILALMNEPQPQPEEGAKALRLLVKSGVNLNAKNLNNETALNMALINVDIERILLSFGAKLGEHVNGAPTLANTLTSKITIMDKVVTYVNRFRSDILDAQRNTWLIIATLVATATYQSALSPPGGFYQANSSGENLNTTSSFNSTISSSSLGNAGKSVLSRDDFIVFSHLNVFSFIVSTMGILIMTPWGVVGGALVFGPVVWFAASYLYSMWVISPTPFNSRIDIIFLSIIGFVMGILSICIVYSKLQRQQAMPRN